MLSPNCSEVTIRIKINDLTENEIIELEQAFERVIEETGWEDETWYERENWFGLKILTVSGQGPWHHFPEYEKVLKGMSFRNKYQWRTEED